MKHYRRALVCWFVIALLSHANAQTGSVTVLHNFIGPPNGLQPQASLFLGAGANFYGVTAYGGTGGAGTLFKMTPAGVVTTLRSFTRNGALGSNPLAPLVQASDGSFYGTTCAGGSSHGGVLFHIHTDGTASVLQTYWYFSNPSLVKGADGNIYGTTQNPDAPNNGTVFKVTAGDNVSTVYNFANTGCSNPSAALVIDSTGLIYGAAKGGTLGNGVLFTITPTGTFSILHNFGSQTGDGATPSGLTLGKDGNIYGTTGHGTGKFFSVTPQGQLTNISSLNFGNSTNDATLTLGADGNFYGTDSYGGHGDQGVVFCITPAGAVTILHSFSGPDGSSPLPAMTLGGDGNLYGAAASGGGTNYGTIFRITPSGTFAILYNCVGGSDGYFPTQPLIQGAGGNLYGVTYTGGRNAWGTVFTLTTGGSMTLLHEFSNDGTDGITPLTSLTLASNGLIYGLTCYGGSYNYGTLFSLSPNGNLSLLHSFNGSYYASPIDCAYPGGPLLAAKDGNLYGTAEDGGASDYGAAFVLNPLTNGYSIFHSFGTNDPVQIPNYGLIQGMDGNFYGYAAGSTDNGAVYELSQLGEVSLLSDFSVSGGPADPYCDLLQASDGNFYGVTDGGGAYLNGGAAFMLSAGGALQVLHSFGLSGDGANPLGSLIQASDGTLYGTTSAGGANGLGTLFSITAAGQVTILHSFNGADGAYPDAALLPGQDGSLYGVTTYGGVNDAGVVFRFVLAPAGKFGISSLTRAGANTSHLVCYGAPNTAYRIESSSDMKSGYSTLATVTSDANGAFQYDDAASVSARFYRLAYP